MKEENITVIAGGSGGIGRSVVRKFLRKGDLYVEKRISYDIWF